MNKILSLIHKAIIDLGFDDIVAKYSYSIPFIWRLMPSNALYRDSVTKRVRRADAEFELNISDYMQWHVYANIPEPLWNPAFELLQSPAVIFDVGANIGAFTLKVAKYSSKKKIACDIYAFEPNHIIVKKLKGNIDLNPEVRDNIRIEPLALSDREGEIFLEYSMKNSGAGRLTEESTEIKANMISLDTFVQQKQLKKVDLIKIDVEGFEPMVIKGGQYTIERYKPTLLLEITNEWFQKMEYSANDIFQYLTGLGYQLFSDIGEKARPFISSEVPVLPYQFNILAVNAGKQ